MIKALYINNYALIEKLEIEFHNGFSVITGETGAGKSILLGALSLILGKRADTSVLFNKNAKCIVEGQFDISKLKLESFFSEHNLDFEEQSLLRREIAVNGKSRAFINDTPVNLSVLKKIGMQLVDIHSQQENLQLNNSAFQLEVIDKFGTDEELLFDYSEKFIEYKLELQKLEELKTQNETSKRDEDYFRFQFNELEAAHLDEEEINNLIEKEKLLSHAEEVNSVLETAKSKLEEDEDSVVGIISHLVDSFSKLVKYHEKFKDIHNRLSSVNIELNDVVAELANLVIDGDFDENSLQTINSRLDLVYSLQQKHSVNSVAELNNLKKEFEIKLSGISNLEDEIATMESGLLKGKTKLTDLAERLSKQRKKSAESFSVEISKQNKKLGMPDADFFVGFKILNDLSVKGLDKIDFLFNPNKGGQAGEVSKIASGGELSRLMLAIKSLITNRKLLPTIIFDEIDSGVSGDIAGKVGKMLRQMSNNHQLIAISHLPQIAAKADSHYFVFKENKNGKTTSRISLLKPEDRVEEIAKLLSDEKVSAAARETARGLMG